MATRTADAVAALAIFRPHSLPNCTTGSAEGYENKKYGAQAAVGQYSI